MKKVYSVLFLFFVAIMSKDVFAQGNPDQPLAVTGQGSQELVSQGNDPLILKYDDMPTEYGGFRRSSLLFVPRESKSPSLSTFSLGLGINPEGNGRKPAFGTNPGVPLELSVDDEISKSVMPIFMDKIDLQTQYSNDKRASDATLNLFSSARGITSLTLTYLDKTVAGGIATIQQEADMDTTHQLLKQMNWNIAKLANPQRSQLFDDVDEKFAACIRKDTGPTVAFDAQEQCYNTKEIAEACALKDREASPYSFCVCCAEKVSNVNKGTTGDSFRQDSPAGVFYDQGWSLVDRSFMGLKIPTGSLFTEEIDGKKLPFRAGEGEYELSTFFRSLYGDIVFSKGTDGMSQGFRYVPPSLSVPQWIRAIRELSTIRNELPYKHSLNFDPNANLAGRCMWESRGGMWLRFCPSFGNSIKKGICPALEELISIELNNQTKAMYDDVNGQRANLLSLWGEASLGGAILTNDTLRTIAEKSSTPNGQRFIESFCDASAVGAFRKLHAKMIAMTEDHLTMNRKISDTDRRSVRELVDRVSKVLEMGMKDSQAPVDQLLIALGTEKDREVEANRSALIASTSAARNLSRSASRIPGAFGGRVSR